MNKELLLARSEQLKQQLIAYESIKSLTLALDSEPALNELLNFVSQVREIITQN